MKTKVEIIIGCMFSGKSTELLRRCNRFKSINKKILLINHVHDIRTKDNIKTHDNFETNALKIDNLSTIFEKYNDLYNNSDVIGIDEAQFFPDLKEFILKSENDSKVIIIAGLDGDSDRNPFGQVLECIPLCDDVVKLKALDMLSNDGSYALFSKRIVNSNEKVLVGSSDKYIAVNRENYLK
tara:strand:+ start:160 stop:705 length:546 start_codon:yes stop_codon:yes gene_type:complete